MSNLTNISLADTLDTHLAADTLAVHDTLAVTPADILGAESRLVKISAETLHNMPDMGTIFQVVAIVIALGYIISLVIHADTLGYILRSAFSSRTKPPKVENLSAESRNLETAMLIIGLCTISLFVMRYAAGTTLIATLDTTSSMALWRLGGITIGGLVALIAFESLSLYIIGHISERTDICKGLMHIKLLHFGAVIALITPPILLYLLTSGRMAEVALWLLIFECCIALILFVKETFLFFHQQRVSIFHWILYLCALELAPITLLLAPILRDS